MTAKALRDIAAERRYDAAVEMIRAADNLRLLLRIAFARSEPIAQWVDESHLSAVKVAREIFDRHGDFRPTSARR